MLDILRRLPETLKRVTSGAVIIKEIDGFRFLAIFTVLIQHLHERFIKYTSITFTQPAETTLTAFVATRGFIGVYVFFMISGFILALPFAKRILNQNNELRLKEYFLRRLTRLEPPYIIWMTIFFIGFIILRNESFNEYLPHLLANLTYTHGIIYQGWSLINPPTWTLEVEVQFYILAPFLAFLYFSVSNKNRRRVLMIIFILSFMIIQQAFELYRLPWYLTILAYLQYFLGGFMVADIYLTEWNTSVKGNKLLYDVFAIASLIAIIIIWDWEFHFIDRVAEVILLFILFISVFKGKYANKFFTNRWIMAIGGMCYTIYLIHLPIAEVLMQLTSRISITNIYEVNLLVQAAIFLPIVFIISVVGYLLFEKPFMDKNWPARFKKFIQRTLY
ncbi:MAG: acyltransferase [Cyclobacteriaceae bacterium]|nr:acyltransferase [Cyclobacteriaceae bacterium]